MLRCGFFCLLICFKYTLNNKKKIQAGAQAGGDLEAAGLVLVDPEEAQEETGWKLVHGDVFRPPTTSPMLLSVFTGTGVQIFACTLILMFFAVLGFLSPANRGMIRILAFLCRPVTW